MTLGCDFEKKTFTVPMGSSVKVICEECGKECLIGRRYNYRNLCKKCFDEECKSKCDWSDIKSIKFLTTPDQLYHFVDVNTTGKPIQFDSKRQWQRHLKKLGLNDDIKQSRTKDEIMQSFEKHRKFKSTPREEIKKQIWSELKSKGLNDKILKRR